MSMAEVLEEFGVEVVVWRFHFARSIERSGNASAILGEKQKRGIRRANPSFGKPS
jgi:hypothetical protein